MKLARNLLVRGLCTAALLVGSTAVQAADYPSRDMTFVVPYGTGGSTDPISRKFVEQLRETLGGPSSTS